jgi:hypothetical protein
METIFIMQVSIVLYLRTSGLETKTISIRPEKLRLIKNKTADLIEK